MGLIRKAIVLGGIVWALPAAHDVQMGGAGAVTDPGASASLQSSTFAAIEAATGTVADLKGFCARQPQACVAGQYLAYTFEAKAKYLVHTAYAWSAPQSEQPGEQPAPTVPAKPTKSGTPPLRMTTLNDQKPTSIDDLLHGTSD